MTEMSNNSDVESAGQRISPPPGRGGPRYGNGSHIPPSPFYNDPITLEKTHKPWLVPTIVVVEIIVFVFEMVVNNCPGHDSAYGSCVAKFLGRLSFQPWKENPLLGPTSNTYVLYNYFLEFNSDMIDFLTMNNCCLGPPGEERGSNCYYSV